MGTMAKAKSLMYRAARKFVVVNKSQFFALDDLSDVVCTSDLGGKYQFEVFDDVSRIGASVAKFAGSDLMHLLEEQSGLCTVASDGDHPIAFAWWAFGDIPAELNHDGHPLTGLPLTLPPDMAYLFNVFVRPDYRGQRLYPNLVRHSQRLLGEKGIRRITLATEYTNRPALRSVERMGFHRIGDSRLVNLLSRGWARYPVSPMDNGVHVGRYVGDTNFISTGQGTTRIRSTTA